MGLLSPSLASFPNTKMNKTKTPRTYNVALTVRVLLPKMLIWSHHYFE
jgi:hypothetical protein